ncbi:MAG: relaxase/mobilization nuclease domain-containing protein [Oscillospiraceae bacterium]|jgi:hypothetical protein|nr:relaxase/mobilization nuclease domain-containing protein [Oscillospiraceae bacterium]
MAYTSIWSVKGWLGKVVIYAENPDKTENPAFFEKQNMSAQQAQELSDVIDYAARSDKTQLIDEHTEILRQFVTGVNCQPETARDEMTAVKKKFGKNDGVVAYHGIQSFAENDRRAAGGKLTPELAHEIGVKLAEKLWGEKYQVVVATHLDTESHLHSHFVVNTVSWLDGIRYHRTAQDYYNMQRESDALCREYGLSVIEEPQRGKSKQYGEWKADKEGEPTYRNLVKSDVDSAIAGAMTERQFWDKLRKKGYEIKFGKDVTLRPIGRERGLKLFRNFGVDYAIERIRKRILEQPRPERRIIQPNPPPHKKIRLMSHFACRNARKGLRALYYYYLYKMGVLPKRKSPNPKQVYFIFREDIRRMRSITLETRFLVKYRIDTPEHLTAHKDSVTAQIVTLSGARKRLRYKLRSVRGEGTLVTLKSEIAVLSEQIGELRREVQLCVGIETRSAEMSEKLRAERDDKKFTNKELIKNEPFRGRR